MKELRT